MTPGSGYSRYIMEDDRFYTFLLLAQVMTSEVEPADTFTTLLVSLPFSNAAMTFFFSYLD